MSEKGYLEYIIKDIKMSLEIAEHSFDGLVAAESRNYDAIIKQALEIKSMQDELKGLEKALVAMQEN